MSRRGEPQTLSGADLATLIETALVLAGIVLFISAKTVQPYMWLGVALLAGSFGVRWLGCDYLAVRTPLDWPLLLFVVSALIGVWAAYDQPVAWVKFLHILGGVALYYLLASRGGVPWFATATVLALSLFAAALALAFVTQFDYAAQPGKFAFVTRLGMLIAGLSPQLGLALPHQNIVAGTLALIAPLSVAAALGATQRALRLVCALCAACLLLGVVMTTSRGAWLALAGVTVTAGAAAWLGRRTPERWHGRLALGAIVALAAAALAILLLAPDLLLRALGSIPGAGQALGRAELYRQAWDLIGDAIFSGSGLGMFGMVYATYARLDWVHFLAHAHNVFLEVWIEQGVLGFAALLWLVIAFYAAAWRWRKRLGWLGWGCVAATTVMLAHGVVDNPLYSFRVLPLLFVPLGLIMPANGAQAGERRGFGKPGVWLAAIGIAVVLAVAGRNQLAALWHANLGSVAQAKVELRDYSFPERLVDYVRRDGDLSAAEREFQQALTSDPANRTARQRLALIALGRSEHEQALAYIEPAYARDGSNRVTRQLLCEAYLGLGRLDEAYQACAGVPEAARRLQGVANVRYDPIKDTQRAAWARELAQRLVKEQGDAR